MRPPLRRPVRGLPLRAVAPNAVTALALCFGLSAIRYGIAGDWERAVLMIMVAGVLDGLDGRPDADLVTELSDLIPVTVICEMLGVPHEDHEQCRAWSEEIALAIEPAVPDEMLRRADAATDAYLECFTALIAEKRARPCDDLLTLLIRAEDQGDRLSNEELVAMATLLLGASSSFIIRQARPVTRVAPLAAAAAAPL